MLIKLVILATLIALYIELDKQETEEYRQQLKVREEERAKLLSECITR